MKSYVRVTVFAMAFALAFALAACGGSNASSSASASSASASSESASASSASASASSESASASSASASSASAASADFVKGTVNGDTYKSEFFGVQYTLPEGFTFYDDTKTAEINGGLATADEISQALQSGAEYYDAAAESDAGSTVTLSVVYAGTPEAKALDAKGFVEAMAQGAGSEIGNGVTIKEAQSGVYVNQKTGEEFPAVKRTVDVQGQEYVQEVLVQKAGDYYLAVTATALDDAALDAVLCNFTAQ